MEVNEYFLLMRNEQRVTSWIIIFLKGHQESKLWIKTNGKDLGPQFNIKLFEDQSNMVDEMGV